MVSWHCNALQPAASAHTQTAAYLTRESSQAHSSKYRIHNLQFLLLFERPPRSPFVLAFRASNLAKPGILEFKTSETVLRCLLNGFEVYQSFDSKPSPPTQVRLKRTLAEQLVEQNLQICSKYCMVRTDFEHCSQRSSMPFLTATFPNDKPFVKRAHTKTAKG